MRNPDADPSIDPLATAIAGNDLAGLRKVIEQHPRAVHTHTSRPRPWGDELWLPLHRAALAGHVDLVQALLDSGAQPDSRTRFLGGPEHARATALHFAAAAGHVDVVRLLLQAGADPEVRDADQLTPLHLSPKGSPVADALRASGARDAAPQPEATRATYTDLL